MDSTQIRLGTRVNLGLVALGLTPTMLLLYGTESPDVGYAVGIAALGYACILALAFNRTRLQDRETGRFFEVAAAALFAGTAYTLTHATWDLITGLYVTFSSLALAAGCLDEYAQDPE